jgi:hypothetical protein
MSLNEGTKSSLRVALANDSAYQQVKDVLQESLTLFDSVDVVQVTETVTLTNAVFTNLTNTLPAGAGLLSTKMRLNALVVGDETGDNGLTKVGLGTAASASLYGLTDSLLANQKTARMISPASVVTATTLRINACANNGAAVTEKFVAGTSVEVELVYLVPKALPDA